MSQSAACVIPQKSGNSWTLPRPQAMCPTCSRCQESPYWLTWACLWPRQLRVLCLLSRGHLCHTGHLLQEAVRPRVEWDRPGPDSRHLSAVRHDPHLLGPAALIRKQVPLVQTRRRQASESSPRVNCELWEMVTPQCRLGERHKGPTLVGDGHGGEDVHVGNGTWDFCEPKAAQKTDVYLKEKTCRLLRLREN